MNNEYLKALIAIAVILFKGFCVYIAYQVLTAGHPVWAFFLFIAALDSAKLSFGKGDE